MLSLDEDSHSGLSFCRQAFGLRKEKAKWRASFAVSWSVRKIDLKHESRPSLL